MDFKKVLEEAFPYIVMAALLAIFYKIMILLNLY